MFLNIPERPIQPKPNQNWLQLVYQPETMTDCECHDVTDVNSKNCDEQSECFVRIVREPNVWTICSCK